MQSVDTLSVTVVSTLKTTTVAYDWNFANVEVQGNSQGNFSQPPPLSHCHLDACHTSHSYEYHGHHPAMFHPTAADLLNTDPSCNAGYIGLPTAGHFQTIQLYSMHRYNTDTIVRPPKKPVAMQYTKHQQYPTSQINNTKQPIITGAAHVDPTVRCMHTTPAMPQPRRRQQSASHTTTAYDCTPTFPMTNKADHFRITEIIQAHGVQFHTYTC
ncbi:hypothetical protein PR048_019905 [Dryococelus australis]|uniref:Uncharacterized protein n=1 Tax=Dryococelus australis TaxID=614101 RepID=A0ABQ9H4W3_9NEOP|nr:hypothetical protein PR048_019905 [Dryococelus australis]